MTTKATVLHAIRQKCLDCSCYQLAEVRDCPVTRCDLWPYRFGRDPEPSPNRGFGKSSGYTRGLRPDTDGRHPGGPELAPLSESPVYADDFGEGAPAAGSGKVERPAPVPALVDGS